jgi:hypothetical protein
VLLANSGDHKYKKLYWYPLKSALCRQFGTTDGYDFQHITRKCYCGDGIFRGPDGTAPNRYWEPCNRCNGTGTYSKKIIVLRRWLIGNHLFHEPTQLSWMSFRCQMRERIDGYINHDPKPDPATSNRALMRLLLRYQPATWAKIQWNSLTGHKSRLGILTRRINTLIATRNQPKYDDIPF